MLGRSCKKKRRQVCGVCQSWLTKEGLAAACNESIHGAMVPPPSPVKKACEGVDEDECFYFASEDGEIRDEASDDGEIQSDDGAVSCVGGHSCLPEHASEETKDRRSYECLRIYGEIRKSLGHPMDRAPQALG